jgi:outer membrane translocation and assembly module TamA
MIKTGVFKKSILIILTFVSINSYGQRKLIEKFLSSGGDSTRSGTFFPLPVLAYSQETGFEFGVLPMYAFYTDKTDKLTRSSVISALATFTTKKQSSFYLKSDIWTPENRYHVASEFRYKDFPILFYGVGSNTLDANKEHIDQKLFRLRGEAEKRFGRSFTGVNLSYENYKFADRNPGGIYPGSVFNPEGGEVLFAGISQILDSRNSNIYPTNGFYLKLNYSYAPDLFGGSNFEGSQTKIDVRSFKPLNEKTVLGINGAYQTIQGTRAPFYLLPQLGNDMIMRGYYSGRYRDQNLLALQGEIRYRFIPRLGAAAFLGAGTVYSNRSLSFRNVKPSVGAGLRYFYDVERGLSVRADYAIGEKRPGEKLQKGFYLSLGEAF